MWYYDFRMSFSHIIWEHEKEMSVITVNDFSFFFIEKDTSKNILDELIAFQILLL